MLSISTQSLRLTSSETTTTKVKTERMTGSARTCFLASIFICKKPFLLNAFNQKLSYAGLRAGGGIGDEMDPPGEDDFLARFAFDITFFFFIIVIILAIIQVKWNLKFDPNCANRV